MKDPVLDNIRKATNSALSQSEKDRREALERRRILLREVGNALGFMALGVLYYVVMKWVTSPIQGGP